MVRMNEHTEARNEDAMLAALLNGVNSMLDPVFPWLAWPNGGSKPGLDGLKMLIYGDEVFPGVGWSFVPSLSSPDEGANLAEMGVVARVDREGYLIGEPDELAHVFDTLPGIEGDAQPAGSLADWYEDGLTQGTSYTLCNLPVPGSPVVMLCEALELEGLPVEPERFNLRSSDPSEANVNYFAWALSCLYREGVIDSVAPVVTKRGGLAQACVPALVRAGQPDLALQIISVFESPTSA